ncbi:MAG: diacylglycerol kinase [Erysipelotrichaceae bacterium]|nr:diacylglycerol kinase [Erysipelotrichaceae bacterium]
MNDLKSIIGKFRYAWNGFIHGLKYDRSIRVQCVLAAGAIAVSLLLHFSAEELAIVMLFCALIIGLEFVNSSIERIMNLEEPEISKSVKHIKDMAAAGVLTASFFALIVGIMFVIRHLK